VSPARQELSAISYQLSARVCQLLLPIQNFQFQLKTLGFSDDYEKTPPARTSFYCFLHCRGCGADIGGYFAVLVPGKGPYHAACLLRRGQRPTRKTRANSRVIEITRGRVGA